MSCRSAWHCEVAENCLIQQNTITKRQGRLKQAALLFRVRRRWNEQKTMQSAAAAGAAAPGGGGCSCRAFCPAPHRAGAGCRTGTAGGCGGAAGGSRFLRSGGRSTAQTALCRRRLCRLFPGLRRHRPGTGHHGKRQHHGDRNPGRFPRDQAVSAAHQAAFDHHSGGPELGGGCRFRGHLHQPGHSGRSAERPDRRGGEQPSAAPAQAHRTAGGGGIYGSLHLPGRHLHCRSHRL